MQRTWKTQTSTKGKKSPTQGKQLSVFKCKLSHCFLPVYIFHLSMTMRSCSTGLLVTALYPFANIMNFSNVNKFPSTILMAHLIPGFGS